MTRERQDNVSLSGAKGFIMMTSGAVCGHGQIWSQQAEVGGVMVMVVCGQWSRTNMVVAGRCGWGSGDGDGGGDGGVWSRTNMGRW